MRIAQISPLYEAVPPRLYGGTERVVAIVTAEPLGTVMVTVSYADETGIAGTAYETVLSHAGNPADLAQNRVEGMLQRPVETIPLRRP